MTSASEPPGESSTSACRHGSPAASCSGVGRRTLAPCQTHDSPSAAASASRSRTVSHSGSSVR
ncbi:Uncharacterised protein [Mycobacteroides abscessus]|nr:Uncharacterised protein [Mycobacteroides abscessus]